MVFHEEVRSGREVCEGGASKDRNSVRGAVDDGKVHRRAGMDQASALRPFFTRWTAETRQEALGEL